MYYWNQENFEGLKRIAKQYQHDAQLSLFAEYCTARQAGLRKLAFQTLDQFIQKCQSEPFEQQKSCCLSLLNLIKQNSQFHTLSSTPLNLYMIDVLKAWQHTDPAEILTYEWLGYLTYDLSYYQQGLLLDPNHQTCLKAIISSHLRAVDWQTHHFSDSYLIGDFNDAWAELTQIDLLLLRLHESLEKQFIEQDKQEYKQKLIAWRTYQIYHIHHPNQADLQDFPEWCNTQHLPFYIF